MARKEQPKPTLPQTPQKPEKVQRPDETPRDDKQRLPKG